jgi:hypothetical protein
MRAVRAERGAQDTTATARSGLPTAALHARW